jgi:hypothetical protein
MVEQFLLEVDGTPVRSLTSFRGLDVEAEIASRGTGPHNMPKKHVAGIRWTPGVASFGGGMGKGMHGWIAETLDRGSAVRGGSVAVAGPDGAATFSVAFSGGRLTSVTLPALDGASKEPAAMAVEFVARNVTWGKGAVAAVQPADRSTEWLQSNFRVELGDLPCNRVARVDALTWTCAADGTVTVPDLRLVISRADLGPWEEAARRWFIDHEYRDKHEMSGRISLLAANAKDVLADIEFGNVGLRRFSHDEVGGGAFAVVLYAEKIGLKVAA